VIFSEVIDKKLKEDVSYKYTADRLREIGKGLSTEQMVIKMNMKESKSRTIKKRITRENEKKVSYIHYSYIIIFI
jgi:hypothetical protein